MTDFYTQASWTAASTLGCNDSPHLMPTLLPPFPCSPTCCPPLQLRRHLAASLRDDQRLLAAGGAQGARECTACRGCAWECRHVKHQACAMGVGVHGPPGLRECKACRGCRQAGRQALEYTPFISEIRAGSCHALEQLLIVAAAQRTRCHPASC